MKSWSGECVTFSNCAYSKSLLEGLANSDDLEELQDRKDACQAEGQGFVCCEKSAPAIEINTHTTEIPSRTSDKANLLMHRNYDLFKNLNCGKSALGNRVSNGKF